MKTLIKHVIDNLDEDNIVHPQFRCEYLKYEIKQFSIIFQKVLREIRKMKERNWTIN